jgi:hypothetical protein
MRREPACRLVPINQQHATEVDNARCRDQDHCESQNWEIEAKRTGLRLRDELGPTWVRRGEMTGSTPQRSVESERDGFE